MYLNEKAPVDASAAAADAAEDVAEFELFVACVLAVLLLEAEEVALEAEAVAEFALAVAEFALAVALVAAAFCEVVAEAASTMSAHLAASVLLAIGWEPLEVCATVQM